MFKRETMVKIDSCTRSIQAAGLLRSIEVTQSVPTEFMCSKKTWNSAHEVSRHEMKKFGYPAANQPGAYAGFEGGRPARLTLTIEHQHTSLDRVQILVFQHGLCERLLQSSSISSGRNWRRDTPSASGRCRFGGSGCGCFAVIHTHGVRPFLHPQLQVRRRGVWHISDRHERRRRHTSHWDQEREREPAGQTLTSLTRAWISLIRVRL